MIRRYICYNLLACFLFSFSYLNSPAYGGQDYILLSPSYCMTDYCGTGGCCYPDIYGESVKEIAQQWIVTHNNLTTDTCQQCCRNPAALDEGSINENTLVFDIISNCTGARYSYTKIQKIQDLPMKNYGEPDNSCSVN